MASQSSKEKRHLAHQRAAQASLEKEQALKRLREAEARLKGAIQDLHDDQSSNDVLYTCMFRSRHPLCQHPDSCIANTIGSFCQSFLLAYGIRAGVGILLRGFKLARNKSYLSIFDLKLLLSEKNLIVREEACRIGLLFGGFTGCYHGIRCFLQRIRNKQSSLDEFIAGGIAGLSVLALDDSSRRRTLALYLLARLGQCIYNSVKAKKKLQFWASKWQHGDTLLFSLGCAQVMYAYVMQPETLPLTYLDFISRTGPIAEPVLNAIRQNCKGEPIDLGMLSDFVSSRKPGAKLDLDQRCSIIPCSVIHPDTSSCIRQTRKALYSTFKKILPLYISLAFVPAVMLNLQKAVPELRLKLLRIGAHLVRYNLFVGQFDIVETMVYVISMLLKTGACLSLVLCQQRLSEFLDTPMLTVSNSLRTAARSTSFISAFVAMYQSCICLQRKVALKDHYLVYWFGGAISALSVLLEKKSRRAEFALYVLPHAADSLLYILKKRHILPDIKYAEVALFCLSTGGLMFFHDREPLSMAPLLDMLIKNFVSRKTSSLETKEQMSNDPRDVQAKDGETEEPSHPENLEKLKTEAFYGL